jgi:hypothetical protein
LLTFHKLIEECAGGRAESWRVLAAEYTPVCMAMLKTHLRPANAPHATEAWRLTLRSLAASGFEQLRALDRQSEKEFLLTLRRLALACAASAFPSAPEAEHDAAISAIEASLQGRPLTHQQIVFLKLAGYDDSTVEHLLRVAPTLIQRACESRSDVERPDAVDWFRFLRHAWSSATEGCTAPRKLVRLQEGQTNWYDREPVERHMTACAHCLELWTALAEVRYWRREARPLPEAEAARLLDALGLALAAGR